MSRCGNTSRDGKSRSTETIMNCAVGTLTARGAGLATVTRRAEGRVRGHPGVVGLSGFLKRDVGTWFNVGRRGLRRGW